MQYRKQFKRRGVQVFERKAGLPRSLLPAGLPRYSVPLLGMLSGELVGRDLGRKGEVYLGSLVPAGL